MAYEIRLTPLSEKSGFKVIGQRVGERHRAARRDFGLYLPGTSQNGDSPVLWGMACSRTSGSCQRGVGVLHMHQGGDALASGASYDLFGLRRARELVVRVSVPVEA